MTVFWLDAEQVLARLERATVSLACEHPEIEEIWLFGSLARHEARPGSDADLLLVLRHSPLSFLDRSVLYQPEFCGVGADILAYTRAELAQMEVQGNRFAQRAQAEGVCLFRR